MKTTRTILSVGALTVGLTMTAPLAHATLLDFSYVGSGTNSGESASWTMDSNPTPIEYLANYWTNISVTDPVESTGSFDIVEFTADGFITGDGQVADSSPGLAFHRVGRIPDVRDRRVRLK